MNWNLEKVKQYLKNFVERKEDYYMVVTNKETNEEGCAIIRDDKKIAVFEGKNDGSDDKIFNQKEFKEKYRIDALNKAISDVTVEDIEETICELDSDYREELADALVKFKYISDTPLELSLGTEKQREELKKMWTRPLKAKEIENIITRIRKRMVGDFQYGRFVRITSYYLQVANELKKTEEKQVKRALKSNRER